MRHVRDVIRLKSAGMPTREIARRLGTAPSTVRLTIRRFEAAGLTWPLSDDITDTELEARLFASAGAGPGTRRGHRRQAEPDWAAVHRELRRKHVTLSILGRSTSRASPAGITIRASASSTRLGGLSIDDRCGNRTRPATSCSSTMPATACRW
jgi:transposase